MDPEFKDMVTDTLQLLKDKLELVSKKVTGVSEEVVTITPTQGNTNLFKSLSFTGSSKEDARSFIEKFLAHADLYKWSEDKKLQDFRKAISDLAEIWYRVLPTATKSSWDSLLTAFNKKFRNEKDKWILEGTLHTRQQLPGESVELFTGKMRKPFCKLDKSKSDKLTLFVHGLRPELRSFVLGKNPKTVDEAESAARLYESVGVINTQRQQPASSTTEALASMKETIKALETKILNVELSGNKQGNGNQHLPQPTQQRSDRTTDGLPLVQQMP